MLRFKANSEFAVPEVGAQHLWRLKQQPLHLQDLEILHAI